jgi:phosphoribosyl 1,2-cyclic phosphodiesterase
MSEQPPILTIRGARGSATTPGQTTLRHGGHTTCLDVALSPWHRLLIDCGSGLRALLAVLPDDPGPDGFRFDVFMTHYHTDHLEGLPFFKPLYDPRSEFVFRGPTGPDGGVRSALEGSMMPPWFPVPLSDTGSRKSFVDLDREPVWIGDVQVTAAPVGHPQGAVAYRLQRGDRSIVFVTDCEPVDPSADTALRKLMGGAEVLIHDAQYTPEEYEEKYKNWGHSSWRHAVQAARDSGAGRLVLFHHDPDRTDDELDRIVEQARSEFPATEAAHEGMVFPL